MKHLFYLFSPRYCFEDMNNTPYTYRFPPLLQNVVFQTNPQEGIYRRHFPEYASEPNPIQGYTYLPWKHYLNPIIPNPRTISNNVMFHNYKTVNVLYPKIGLKGTVSGTPAPNLPHVSVLLIPHRYLLRGGEAQESQRTRERVGVCNLAETVPLRLFVSIHLYCLRNSLYLNK